MDQNRRTEMDDSVRLMTLLLQHRSKVWRSEAAMGEVLEVCDRLLVTRDQMQVFQSELLRLREFDKR